LDIRISAQQKNAMLAIHFIELKHGVDVFVHTSYLRKHVGESLGRELTANHFLVALRKLNENGYLTFRPNLARELNSSARVNESMWQLTSQGRAYAEALHFSRLRPKRPYNKKS